MGTHIDIARASLAEARAVVELMTSAFEEDQEKISSLLSFLEEPPEPDERSYFFEHVLDTCAWLETEGRDRWIGEDAEKARDWIERAARGYGLAEAALS